MTKIEKRMKARVLRKNGKSLRDVAETLKVSKSSVSNWCRDICLSSIQRKKLQGKQKEAAIRTLIKSAQEKKNRRKKQDAESQFLGGREVGKLSDRDLFMIGLALYWGEGYKKGNREVGFTNSDPRIIKIITKWFVKFYGVKKNDFILRVGINHIHKSREDEVLRYWSDVTRIPQSQFTQTSFIKTTQQKKYKNINEHFGTLRIKVRRGSQLKQRILGSLETIK